MKAGGCLNVHLRLWLAWLWHTNPVYRDLSPWSRWPGFHINFASCQFLPPLPFYCSIFSSPLSSLNKGMKALCKKELRYIACIYPKTLVWSVMKQLTLKSRDAGCYRSWTSVFPHSPWLFSRWFISYLHSQNIVQPGLNKHCSPGTHKLVLFFPSAWAPSVYLPLVQINAASTSVKLHCLNRAVEGQTLVRHANVLSRNVVCKSSLFFVCLFVFLSAFGVERCQDLKLRNQLVIMVKGKIIL